MQTGTRLMSASRPFLPLGAGGSCRPIADIGPKVQSRRAEFPKHWQPLVIVAGTVAIAGALLYRPPGSSGQQVTQNASVTGHLPALPPMLLRPVTPHDALAFNRRIPFSREPNPAAHAFRFRGDAAAYNRALNCLTQAVYYEAASEPERGQLAVAQVILNRVRHPAFPNSVCAVVYQGSTLPTGCQFTFTCDGSLDRQPSLAPWRRAEKAAGAVLHGGVFVPVGYATHYHANFVVPFWNTHLAKNAVIGTHIFYRWPGAWGAPGAFQRAYPGIEPSPLVLQATAIAARRQQWRKPRPPLPLPEVTVGAHEGVELLSIVALLSDPPTRPESAYATAARAHFSAFSDHTAVQIYRQLVEKDPAFESAALAQLLRAKVGDGSSLAIPSEFTLSVPLAKAGPGFSEALRDFAAVTKFDRFFAEQRSYYASTAAPVRSVAVQVATQLQDFTGTASGRFDIVVAPLLSRALVADCTPGVRDRVLLAQPGTGTRAEPGLMDAGAVADDLRLMLIRQSLARFDCGLGTPRCAARRHALSEQTEAQIIRSLSDRLPNSRGAADTIGPLVVSLQLKEALTAYEANRRWFPTFADFYPVLSAMISNARQPARDPDRAAVTRKQGSSAMQARSSSSEIDPLVCLKTSSLKLASRWSD